MPAPSLIPTTLACALALAASGCGCSPDEANDASNEASAKSNADEPGRAPAKLSFNTDAALFEAALADLDRTIAGLREVADAQTGSWILLEKITNLYMRRARLSGSYDDYAAAEATLAEAFERAEEGAGPVLTRAALNFTLHRLDPVAADLDLAANALVVDDPTRAYIAGLRGDVAFERGDYTEAKARYDESLALDRNDSILAKLARWSFRTGDFDTAEQRYAEARELMLDDALEPRAWLELQLGIMDLDRGRYDEAFAHYREGAALLGGWWLLEEHIAEIAALQGMDAFALELYTDIIARTDKAEFMDAKAGLLAAAGDEAGAAALIAEAEQVYTAQLEQFPSAAYGHALDHYLEFGPPSKAVELAEANFELRPGVPARIALAEARLGVGDAAGALAAIEPALASAWVSADLFWVAAEVLAATGDSEREAELRAKALALNPHVATQ